MKMINVTIFQNGAISKFAIASATKCHLAILELSGHIRIKWHGFRRQHVLYKYRDMQNGMKFVKLYTNH